jgi:MFS family permease
VQSIRVAWQRVRQSSLVQPRDQEDRNARQLYLNTAAIGVAVGGIMSFISVYMARLGADSTMMGWLAAAPALVATLSYIPAAMIAERHADQVRLVVRTALLTRVAFLLCAVVPSVLPEGTQPLVLVVIWSLRMVTDSVANTAWTGVMTQAVSPRRRAVINGQRWALLSVVSAISSAAFGWMLDLVPQPLNYQLVFFISFAVSMLDPLAFARVRVPLMEPAARPAHSGGLARRAAEYFRPVIHEKTFLLFIGATILYRVALNAPAPLFTLFWVNDLHAPDTLIGLRGTVGYAALVVGYLFWGRSANRLGHRQVLTLAALGLAAYPIMTALSPSPAWLFPAAAVWGLTAAGIDVGLFDMMLGSIPKQRQPLFAAVWSIVANAAIFVGPLIGAAIADHTSVYLALIICGVAQVVTTIPFAFLPRDI